MFDFDSFDDEPVNDDPRFALFLLEELFGPGQTVPYDIVVRGRGLSEGAGILFTEGVQYWPKTPQRQHFTLMFSTKDVNSVAALSPRTKGLKALLPKLVESLMDGYQSKGRGTLRASDLKGAKTDTLCVVSVGMTVCFGVCKGDKMDTLVLEDSHLNKDAAHSAVKNLLGGWCGNL